MTEQGPSDASGERSGAERSDDPVGGTERTVEELAERVARWVARTAARAREDAEDIWAEAQALRRKL